MSGLQRASFSGSLWVGIAVLLGAVIQLAQMSSIARVLTPTEVGVVAASLVVLALADTIAGMGIANSIIQRQTATRGELSSLYWFNVAVGFLVAAVLFFSAPVFSWFFRMPELALLVHIIAISFLVFPHGQVSRGILERHMRFKAVGMTEVFGSVVVLVVTLIMLMQGFGPESVAVAYACSVSVKAGLFLYAARHEFWPRWHFRFSETKRFLSFGLTSSLDQIVSFFAANIGSFAVGRLVTPTALGGYNLAFTYAVNTPLRLNGAVTRVAFPAMSQLQEDSARQARAIRRVIDTVTVVNAPVLLTLAIAAGPFTSVFFGEKWLWITGLLQILAGVGLTRAMGNPMGAILMSLNRMGVGLTVNVIKSTVHIAVVIAGAYWGGVFGAAWAAFAMGIVTVLVNIVLLRVLAGIPVKDGVSDHVRPLLASIPMVLVGLGTMWLCTTAVLFPLATLFLVSGVCAATYLVTLLSLRHPLVRDIVNFIKRA